jgi:hypothetical protein
VSERRPKVHFERIAVAMKFSISRALPILGVLCCLAAAPAYAGHWEPGEATVARMGDAFAAREGLPVCDNETSRLTLSSGIEQSNIGQLTGLRVDHFKWVLAASEPPPGPPYKTTVCEAAVVLNNGLPIWVGFNWFHGADGPQMSFVVDPQNNYREVISAINALIVTKLGEAAAPR